MKMAKGSINPAMLLENAAKQNPVFKQTMDDINKYGSPEKAFYEKAKERGMTENDILSSLNEIKSTFNSFGI